MLPRAVLPQEYTLTVRVLGVEGSVELHVHYFVDMGIADGLVAERAKGLVLFGVAIGQVVEVEVYHTQRAMNIFGIMTDTERLNVFGQNQAKSGYSFFYRNIEVN